MLIFEAPLVRIRKGLAVGFAVEEPRQATQHPSASARNLALGHRIVRAMERGEVRNLTEAAQLLAVSQPRVSMVVSLTFLAPVIQSRLLLGGSIRISLKEMVRLARMASWEAQLAAWNARVQASSHLLALVQ